MTGFDWDNTSIDVLLEYMKKNYLSNKEEIDKKRMELQNELSRRFKSNTYEVPHVSINI